MQDDDNVHILIPHNKAPLVSTEYNHFELLISRNDIDQAPFISTSEYKQCCSQASF